MSDDTETLATPQAMEQDTANAAEVVETEATSGDEAEDTTQAASSDAAGEGTDAEDDDEGEGDDEPKRKRPSGVQRLRREVERLRSENERLSHQPAASSDADIEALARSRVGPPPSDADYPDDWMGLVEARATYRAQVQMEVRQIKAAAERSRSTDAADLRIAVAEHHERRVKAAAAIPDFAAVTTAAAKTPVRPDVARMVLESDKSALLEYHLAKHPDIIADLNSMSPTQAARRIGAIEARLSLPKPKTTTSAPPPAKPPRGSAVPSADPSKLSMDEYVKARKAGKL